MINLLSLCALAYCCRSSASTARTARVRSASFGVTLLDFAKPATIGICSSAGPMRAGPRTLLSGAAAQPGSPLCPLSLASNVIFTSSASAPWAVTPPHLRPGTPTDTPARPSSHRQLQRRGRRRRVQVLAAHRSTSARGRPPRDGRDDRPPDPVEALTGPRSSSGAEHVYISNAGHIVSRAARIPAHHFAPAGGDAGDRSAGGLSRPGRGGRTGKWVGERSGEERGGARPAARQPGHPGAARPRADLRPWIAARTCPRRPGGDPQVGIVRWSPSAAWMGTALWSWSVNSLEDFCNRSGTSTSSFGSANLLERTTPGAQWFPGPG